MIRIQPLDGPWQRLGADLYPGMAPFDVQPAWGPAGPESLNFSLPIPPYRVHAALLPFTPVELYPGDRAHGEPLWAGYTVQAPPGAKGEATSVICNGWHYYRDDNPTTYLYVHDDLTAWADVRSGPRVAVGTSWLAGPQVTTGDGAIVLSWPQGGPIVQDTAVGVFLDTGPDPTWWPLTAGITMAWLNASWTADNLVLVRCSDTLEGIYPAAASDTVITLTGATDANGTYKGSTATRRRYWAVYFFRTGATFTPLAADEGVRITELRLFRETDYVSTAPTSIASTLAAHMAIPDIRDRLCPLLSPDDSLIYGTQFVGATPPIFRLPASFSLTEEATARTVMDRFNDYHGYRLGVDSLQRVFFQPQPSVPRLQVEHGHHGVTFKDTSTNDGTDIYNKVLVRGQSGAGEPLLVTRYLADVAAGPAELQSALQFTNPSFDTNASSWTNVTRQTGAFHSSPASGAVTSVPATAAFTGGTFLAGVLYVFQVYVAVTLGTTPDTLTFQVGDLSGTSTNYAQLTRTFVDGPTWEAVRLSWVPDVDVPAASVTWRIPAYPPATFGPPAVWVDTATVTEALVGVLGKRNRLRSFTLTVGAPTSLEAMEVLATAFLLAHRAVPFKADLTITGDAVVDLDAQRHVQASELGRYYGEMIRILGVPNPDTGDLQSRDGIIASVQGLEQAQLAIDSERRSLEALMARMGVVKS